MSRPVELPSPWSEMAAAAGGVGQLADALAVSSRSIQRWAQGLRPGVHTVKLVNAWASRRKIPAPFP